jgi:hypothetical protein
VLDDARLSCKRESRKKQLGDPVGLFEVGISREYERIDSQVRIGQQSRSNGVRIAYERRSSSAPDQADASP